jgi:hypothetical protein
VLQFLLDKQPAGFPLTPTPLWQLVYHYLILYNTCLGQTLENQQSSTVTEANVRRPPLPVFLIGPMQDILAVNQAYMAHFAPNIPREGQAAEPVLPSGSSIAARLNIWMMEKLVNARCTILLILCMCSGETTEHSAMQLKEQLWLSPALADASLAQLAAWCQHHYFQHSNKQQQEEGKEGEVCKQKQKQKKRDSSSSKKGSRNRSPEVGSSSSTSNVAAFKFASASSWSELKVLPDHEQVAVAGGQAAVAAHLWRLTQLHDCMTPSEVQMDYACGAAFLMKSLMPGVGLHEGEKEPLPGDVRLSKRPAATVTALQLALQGVACKGIELEAAVAGRREGVDTNINLVQKIDISPSSTSWIRFMVDLLHKQVGAADEATRRAFLAARGGYALQVMWLVMKEAVREQQQQQRGQQQQPNHQEAVSGLTDSVPGIMCLMFRGADGESFQLEKGEIGRLCTAHCNMCTIITGCHVSPMFASHKHNSTMALYLSSALVF